MLEERTGLKWEEEVYSDIVTQCQTGPVRPVAANPCGYPPTYRNQYCAICNAEKSADLVCANPYDSRSYWDFCLRNAESCFNDSESYDTLSGSSTEQSNMSTTLPKMVLEERHKMIIIVCLQYMGHLLLHSHCSSM